MPIICTKRADSIPNGSTWIIDDISLREIILVDILIALRPSGYGAVISRHIMVNPHLLRAVSYFWSLACLKGKYIYCTEKTENQLVLYVSFNFL